MPALDNSKLVLVSLTFAFIAADAATNLRIPAKVSHTSGHSGKVVNGQNAKAGEIPYQVSLQSNGRHFCGGSLVTRRFVVSAAHCVVAGTVSIALGLVDTRDPEQLLPMKEFTPHPLHDVIPFDHDFAVIELGEDACFGARTTTIVLAGKDVEYPAGTQAVISGWGYSSEFGGPQTPTLPYILQKAFVPLVSKENCQEKWGERIIITDAMQCVGGDGFVSSCIGDSGGPLTVSTSGTPVLIGISSWVEDYCNPEFPCGYAKVSYVREWIDGVIDG